jgi:hypothetical protein
LYGGPCLRRVDKTVVHVREVDFDDLESVAILTRSVGWDAPTVESWKRLWIDNPSLHVGAPRINRGWVLEEGSRVVGFLCNLAQLYNFGGHALLAAIAADLVVAREFRGQAFQLVLAYARQANVDLLLNTTAAPHMSKIFQFLKFDPIPQPHYNRSIYWVLRTAHFLNSGLRKKGYTRAVSRVGSVMLAPLLWGEMRLRGRGPRFRDGRLNIKILPAEAVGSDVDDLWERKIAEGRKLLANRDAQSLRWHFSAAGKSHPPVLICAYGGTRLVGYLALVRQDGPDIHLQRSRIADLFVERDDPAAIRQLLDVAAREAMADGADMLEVIGFPGHFQQLFQEYRPFKHWHESSPFLYKGLQPTLHQELSSADLWHACLYDGDGCL